VNQAVSQGVITVTPQPFIGAESCTCDFLTFGYWDTNITQDNGRFGHHHHHGGQTDIVAQAPWVKARWSRQNNMPLTGTATFTGAMYGQAQDGANAALRNAGGSFTDTFNFASCSGTMAATFDSRNYAGSIGSTGATSFTGNLNSIVPGYNGSFAGSFNSSPGQTPGSIPAGQSGKFGITGPSGYIASGVFGTAVVPGSVR
jgi:hypothetical protein